MPQTPGDRSVRVAIGILAVLLLLPHGCSEPEANGKPGLARVYSGDEPHYLVLLNSVVLDGDLDVANNYRAVHRGSEEAGHRFRGGYLDHHSAWLVNGKYVSWPEIYEWYPEKWDHDADGHPLPKLRAGFGPEYAATKETSMHWPGLAFLLTPFVFLARGTTALEPIAIGCAWLALVFAMIAFASVARTFGASSRATVIALGLTFLGTPIWHYSRALFSEPFALALLFGAFALLFGPRRVVLAGMLCAAALLLKLTYVMMIAPLGLSLVLQRRWKDAVLFGLPLVAAVFVTMLINHATFGSWLRGPQEWLPGHVLTGSVGLVVNPRHGFLLLAPIVVSAAVGWPALWREHKVEARVALASIALMFVLISAFERWEGGMCYGPRYLVPAIPFVMLGLLKRTGRRWDLVALGLVSIAINAKAAFPYWAAFDAHPFAAWLN